MFPAKSRQLVIRAGIKSNRITPFDLNNNRKQDPLLTTVNRDDFAGGGRGVMYHGSFLVNKQELSLFDVITDRY